MRTTSHRPRRLLHLLLLLASALAAPGLAAALEVTATVDPPVVEAAFGETLRRTLTLGLQIDERHDTWGTPYYWLGYQSRRSNVDVGTDLRAVYDGHISVTPLTMNLTAEAMLDQTRQALG